ncbi:hypothetical protein CONPUDRAFT_108344 [Coniophora puteana RWD-64-598 SS2]|uniref:DUF6699 domain-containing protein n=1 Tax=Coniophora puteana (strain RWD-64-598) TaxID=741705 RepID=A0A5M3MGS4_CONPW|nr:uncharacterized protein CONPUDRAFT_108344 [Coniophora puteana RWD-64-598 SS2]EIW78438.1 hypothetical protein CONPUDRAFT_108344 [Coniophora puteana RWD-64-598 SS2]
MPGRVDYPELNPLLAFIPDTFPSYAYAAPSGCAIRWDVRFAPSTARVIPDWDSPTSSPLSSSSHTFAPPPPRQLTPAELAQPATDPPVHSLRLVSGLLAPDWRVVAVASTLRGRGCVTVGNVLSAIHRALSVRVLHSEWARLAPKEGERVSRAFHARWRSAQDEVEQAREYYAGVKRVDWVLDATAFGGLTYLGGHSGEAEAVLTLKHVPRM